MTLIGAINQGNKKILFADRKWSLSKEKNLDKFFINHTNYLFVSGFILNSLIKEFEKGEYLSIEELISNKYSGYNLPGTSFIDYNSESESMNLHIVEDGKLKSSPIINYVFLGCDVQKINETFDFRDTNHTLIPSLIAHYQRYPEYIGNNFDLFIFQNKVSIHSKIKFN